jgi:aspartokinase
MEQTTTDLTKQYIKDNPYIKHCLKKNIINYSSLARLIAKELKIEKKTSKEAILIAARRFRDELKKEKQQETKIKEILSASEFEIKNKITVFILEKNIHFEGIEVIQKAVRNAGGTFYILEGSDNYTLITSEKFEALIHSKMKGAIIKKETGLALIIVKSSKLIESTVGVLAYLTSLFAENDVNILEFLSCWTDTLFIIDANDMNKAIEFLKF